MADLKVDYELLSSTEKTLSILEGEFRNIQSSTGTGAALGSSDIEGAMASFAGNWNDHRRQLVSSMQSLGQLVSAARTHFQQADDKLAASVQVKK